MKFKLHIFLLLCLSSNLNAQTTKVLYLGNSYTGVNNLPQLIYDAAISTGDTIHFDKNTPGGATLAMHAGNATSQEKIQSDDWDFVVLQAQSQEPTFPFWQVNTQTFPFAEQLCDSIRANSSCTRPMFYMTWGREFGDASNCPILPEVCTYEGMDSLLNLRYRIMAEDNDAYVSPVGAVWHYIRDNHPEVQLYSSDSSHPSQAGSYAAACTFYSVILQKDPSLINFNYVLDDATATIIKNAAKVIAYDDLSEWNIGTFDPIANFEFVQTGQSVSFSNTSTNFTSLSWNFGDGSFSTDVNPSHNFENGEEAYLVSLIVDNCGVFDTIEQSINVNVVAVDELNKANVNFFPNPSAGILFFEYSKEEHIEVKIYNAEGLLVHSEKDPSNVDLSSFENGIYLIFIENKTRRKTYSDKLTLRK